MISKSIYLVFAFIVALVASVLLVVNPITATAATPVTKVLIFVEENHSETEMLNQMPYLASQAKLYGYASNYTAAAHPSLPNYLAIAGGSTFGVTKDVLPSAAPEPNPDAFGATIGAGKTAKAYLETMPSNCYKSNSGYYAARHNPWAYFPNDSTCKTFDVPSGTVSSGNLRKAIVGGTLPNVGWVTPNLIHDAHNSTLGAADTWLKPWIQLIYNSPDWKSGNLAVVVTADEDDHSQSNKVLTAVLSPNLSHKVVTTALNHYSMNGFLTRVGHAPCIRNGCSAPNLATAFGLTIG